MHNMTWQECFLKIKIRLNRVELNSLYLEPFKICTHNYMTHFDFKTEIEFIPYFKQLRAQPWEENKIEKIKFFIRLYPQTGRSPSSIKATLLKRHLLTHNMQHQTMNGNYLYKKKS